MRKDEGRKTKDESGPQPTTSVFRPSSFVWLALALAVWLLAVAGATAGFALGRRVYEHGVAYGDPGPARPDLDGPARAINTQLELEADEADLRRSLRLIRAAGFGWIRQQFAWADLEIGGKGQFHDYTAGQPSWARYDRIVALAGEEGLRIIARLDLPPDWARPPGSYKTHPPADVRDYGDFVAAFVARYRGQIGHIQVWNEPNLSTEWGQRPDEPPGLRPVDPAGYVELLKAGYLGAKRANPSVRVLSGELAQTLEPDAPGARGLDDLLYLERMYQHGARPYFDILAANAYGLWTGPDDRQVGARYTNFPRVLLTRDVMLRHGDGGKAIWVTEFGWNALPANWTGNPSPWGHVTPETQARYIVGAYRRARLEWPWAGPMALWLFRQARADDRDPTPHFALVGPDWQARPAYHALAGTAAQVLGPGVHQESSTGLVFEGTWQWTSDPAASLGALRETPVSGASLRFRCQGTRVDVLAPVGPSRGLAYVKINGAATLANRLPLSPSGQATIDFYAPEAQPQRRITLADGLPDRVHEVELTVAGVHAPASTAAGIGIDAIVVSRARPAAPALALAGAWAGSGLVALGLARRRLAARLRRAAAWPAAPAAARRLRSIALALARPAGSHANRVRVGALAALPWLSAGTFAIAASLPFTPLGVRTPAGRFTAAELLLVVCAAGAAAKLYAAGRLEGWRGAFAGPAGLLFVAGAASLVVAEYPRLALREWRTLVVEPVVFYFVARAALRGPADGLRLAGSFAAGAAAAGLWAIAQAASGSGLVAAEGVARAAGPYPSPNNLALLLERAFPLALALALYARPARWAWPAALAAGVCGLALLLTYSRGAWLATALAAAIVVAPRLRRYRAPHRRRALLGAGAVAVPALLAAAALALRYERFWSVLTPHGTGMLRLSVWRAALEMARDHPVWGVGLDQFLYHYPRYMRPEAWREPNLSHPHNLVLDFWLRLGLVGVVALGWAAYRFVGRARRAWAAIDGANGRVQDWEVRQRHIPRAGGASTRVELASTFEASRAREAAVRFALVLGACAAAAAAVVHGLVDNFYFVVDLAYAFWIVVLVLELATDRSPYSLDSPDRPIVQAAARNLDHAGGAS